VAVAAAAAVAIAVPLTKHAHRQHPPAIPVVFSRRQQLDPVRLTDPRPRAARAPVTDLTSGLVRGCASAATGRVPANWPGHNIRVGPVWLMSSGWPSSWVWPGPELSVGHTVIGIQNGTTVQITAAPGAPGQLRFLAPGRAGRERLLSSGRAALTLTGCLPDVQGSWGQASPAPGVTIFRQSYLSSLQGCVPLYIRQLPAGPTYLVTLPVNRLCRAARP
jgi:hypothetical protein